MMLDSIRQYIIKNVNIRHKFVYKGMRNQYEEFTGKIKNVYPRVFTIMLDDNSIKTFSYSDVLIKNLRIY